MSEYILETRDLSKSFLGFSAVSDVNLQVRAGSIHALIGPNGAGKTTVFNLLTRFLDPSKGQIFFRGQDITHTPAAQVAMLGMVRSFQISATFGQMTLLENVRIGLQRQRGGSFDFWRSNKVLRDLDAQAEALLDQVGLLAHAQTLAQELPYGQKRALEIATTLAMNPSLMLLDEPTQGMGHEDVQRVIELIRKVSANRTVLMVEHNMGVVANLCDTVTVLQRGSILVQGDYASVSRDPRVLSAYMGQEQDDEAQEHAAAHGERTPSPSESAHA